MGTLPASLLLHPPTYDPAHFDPPTRDMLRATIDWFERRGKRRLTADFHAHVFYSDFLEFVAEQGMFATLMTPQRDADGAPGKRWDTSRIAAMSEVLGFYGLNYWYPWQVTILGLGPVWQSDNDVARKRAAVALDSGGVGAFGLSERQHGADIYATDMVLTPDGAGGYLASGGKYYIGNGNVADILSVFGRIAGVEGPDQYVFFYATARHENFTLVKNIVPAQMYVAEFRLDDYPVRAEDILHTGAEAFSAALNTVNIGKFNLCFGGIGIATHALYEAITHAHTRVLYGAPVTNFPHVRAEFVEAFARLIAMRLFSDRAVDYFRSASAEDRRYLLYNPVTKMKVTTEAEKVIALLADLVAAKGFEADSYLTIAKMDIGGLPKLEGTVAVNLALIMKFMPAYLFDPAEFASVPTRTDAADDEFLFRQGPARGLSKIRFHDWRPIYRQFAELPNVGMFTEQAEQFTELIRAHPPGGEQADDLDLVLTLTELFTLIVYGQLILEQVDIIDLDRDMVEEVFAVLVRDFSARAVELHGKAGSTAAQQQWALGVIRKPVIDPGRSERLWNQVAALSGTYAMTP
ncbi:MAG: acyl-CoA dehydrogenase [Mycobacterium sp.]